MTKWMLLAVLLALIAGGGGGYWLALSQAPLPAPSAPSATDSEREPLFYRNPMNPAITSPTPAKDEMGMDYIPVYADDEPQDTPAGTVQVDPVTVQTIGIRAAQAARRTLARTLTTVGRVDFDERRLVRLHPKTEGWVEELFVDETGSHIERDAILLNIYAPKLVATQQEYLLALKGLATLRQSPVEDIRRGAEQLVETTRERLRFLDVPEHQIRELEQTRTIKKRLHIHSPAAGVVVHVGVREGQHVTPQTELYRIADLSRVWVYVDIYEDELPWVEVGDHAELRLAAYPGEVFTGKLTYIYPYAEPKTRTVKARMEFSNFGRRLKPDMFAEVTLHADAKVDALTVPSEAIVRSGVREQVFVVRAPGKFEPREVTLGVTSEGLTQIREGLHPGEEVVVSGQFLIDSESKLREATAKMLDSESANPDQPQAGSHDTHHH